MEPSFSKLALLMEYVGTRYRGFQIQKGRPTVQGELEEALRQLTGEPTRVVGASRTDSGVHALGQVVSFGTTSRLPLVTFIKGLNYYLPEDIVVIAIARVGLDFDARRNALSRHYRYTILNRAVRSPLWLTRAYQVGRPLDAEAMARACQSLIGEHDFALLAGAGARPSTVRRVLRADVSRKGEWIVLDIEANAFLPQQVRRTMGALVAVGNGQSSVEAFQGLVQGRECAPPVQNAPAHGLCLVKVRYAEGTIVWRTRGEDL